MGLPEWDGDGKTTILMICGIMCLGFIPFYIIRSLHQHGWKRCRVFFEKRKWLKPLETEDEKIIKQHPGPVAPGSLQSAIPAVLKKIERAYKAPAHITANDHPLDWQSHNLDPEAGLGPFRGPYQPSNRSSGGSWDPVRSHQAVTLAHPVPPTPPNTRASSAARFSWMSAGSSLGGVSSTTTTPPNELANHNNGGPSKSHGKRASIGSVSSLRGLVIPEHLIKEGADLDNGVSDSTPYPMPAYVKPKITDGNYDHSVRRNAMDHGQGTGIGVWLETVRSDEPVSESSSGFATPPSSQESVLKDKATIPVLKAPSQAVSTSSFTPGSAP
ncbi:hypothetical protein B0T20DRAFT_479177 [Sordaria brevicollis]|uniref:Uncharacterized protein n=1 Tax=Sordaria brevicollis TaxID=83679 RepID=A0AAE0PF87_SORBR|nr:hypothetical protein B0T20DRAFT_479177 [Sordaria brevicollis]